MRFALIVLFLTSLSACSSQKESISNFGSFRLTSGGVDGGGGNAVVCRDSEQKIISAEVLDLYEGRVQFGVSPIPSTDTVEEQVRIVMDRLGKGNLPNNFATHLQRGAAFVLTGKILLPDNTGLKIIDDSFPELDPKNNCKIEQLANWTAQDQVLVDGEIWKALDDTNKSALVAHEILYYMYRVYGAKNSVRVRQAVARAFAGTEAVDVKQDLPANHILCFSESVSGSTTPANVFRAFNDASGMLILQLDWLGGELMITKSHVEVDRIPMETLVYNSTPTIDLASTYGLRLNSAYDVGLGMAIEINTSVPSANDNKTLRIGLGPIHSVTMQNFTCAYE